MSNFEIDTVFTEGRHPGEFLKSEARGMRSRDNAVLAGGNGYLAAGTVLGASLLAAAVVAAANGNKGNGVISAVVPGAKAKVGTYVVTMTGPTTFEVVSPSDAQLADGLGAGAYADPEIGFTFTAGATAMQAGDSFAVAVAAGTGKLVPCKAVATDGSAVPAAIVYANYDTTSGDVAAAVVTREAEVYGLRLTWDASISGTPAVQAAAVAALASLGIITR